LFLFLAATVALLYGRRSFPRWRTAIGVLALVLVVIDLFAVNRATNYASPRDPFPMQPALAPALSDGLPFLRIQDDSRLPGHTACANGLAEVYGISPIKPREIDAFMARAPEEVRWMLLGVRYLVTWRGGLVRPDGSSIPAEQLYHAGEPPDVVYTYRLAGEPQFAWVAHEVWAAAGEDKVYALMASPSFDPRQTAIVVGEAPPALPAAGEMESVRLLERHPSRVRLQVDLAAPGLLVLSQALYPGWRAVVNGTSVPLTRADGLLAAVALPAGHSDVVLRYLPTSFVVGIGVSAATLFGCLVALLVHWWRRRER
jgi:hypothetical protein